MALTNMNVFPAIRSCGMTLERFGIERSYFYEAGASASLVLENLNKKDHNRKQETNLVAEQWRTQTYD